ncbi:O-succinylhomoserine sulfhydrylase [Constrictibacter sp. MBR-5]|jgi:O-succinylhomoserine sulfhydrylase|uniref:O-succinylhomoserine sulfhydrylase n=1 Tax=Constrictibacter sp. MBR-5 TaxID=3156467 RepID=UPI00339427A2
MSENNPDTDGWREATLLVRGGTIRSEHRETSEGLYLTSGYVYGSAEEAEASFSNKLERYVYSRYANPTLTMLEDRLRLIEGAEACRTTASGMAAVYAALVCQLKAGGRVVAARALFGSCLYILQEILPRFGVEVELVDGIDLDQWAAALSRPTDVVLVESPSNPTLEIVDLPAIAELAHAAGARVIVDNVFATPLLQKPLKLGADIVVYSATKHIDGQGRCLGGAVLGDTAFIKDVLTPFLRHTGPALSPFNAWVMLKALETLPLRVEKHCRNALEVARFLDGRKGLGRVLYPGLESHPQHALAMRQMTAGGTVIAFELAGGKDAAFRFLNALKLIDISNNLGDSKSLICHPATTTHQRLSDADKAHLGITPGLLRLSVGLEDAADLRDDLEQALAAAS